MATPFTGRVLGLLDRVYRFMGGPGLPDKLETDLPIQVVHDVARAAELGAAPGRENGFFLVEFELVHLAANTQRAVADPYDRLFGPGGFVTGINPEELDIWVIACSAFVSAGANILTVAATMIAYPITFPGIDPATGSPVHYFPIRYGTADVHFSDASGTGDIRVALSTSGAIALSSSLPLKFPRGGWLTVRSLADGALTVQMPVLCWVGPRGALPPGMA